MADFSVPFGRDSEKRLPTSTERQGGFPCGAADQRLFNGLLNRVESELGEVISFFGITPTDDRFTQLREAIEAGIAAATGGGDTSQFLLVSQARARIPIFPQVESADGKINVLSPAAGTVRVPGGVQFLHRGVFPVTTVETDFPTDASKTYHVRWNPTDGLNIQDLASGGAYNPTTLPESDKSFDSTYDDMLIARVITNSSNVAEITNLVNLDRHLMEFENVVMPITDPGANSVTVNTPATITYDFARTPEVNTALTLQNVSPESGFNTNFKSSHGHDHDYRHSKVVTRYQSEIQYVQDYSVNLQFDATARM